MQLRVHYKVSAAMIDDGPILKVISSPATLLLDHVTQDDLNDPTFLNHLTDRLYELVKTGPFEIPYKTADHHWAWCDYKAYYRNQEGGPAKKVYFELYADTRDQNKPALVDSGVAELWVSMMVGLSSWPYTF